MLALRSFAQSYPPLPIETLALAFSDQSDVLDLGLEDLLVGSSQSRKV